MAAQDQASSAASNASLGSWIPASLQGLIARRELDLGRAVIGQRQGPHRSRRAGPGRDFLEHRAYLPGDDPRLLDWRAVGRRDRLVVRRTESEDEFGLALLLDAGGGMHFPLSDGGRHDPPSKNGGAHPTKLDAAIAFAATLAELARRRRDPIGFAVGGGAGASDAAQIQPRASKERVRALSCAFRELSREGKALATAADPSRTMSEHPRCPWDSVLSTVSTHLRRPSLVVAFSDLLDPLFAGYEDPDAATGATVAALASLRARGHSVALVNIVHRNEFEFPWDDEAVRRFVDLHGHRPPVEGSGASLRARYIEKLRAHLDRVEGQCEREGVIYVRSLVDAGARAYDDVGAGLTQLLDRVAIRDAGGARGPLAPQANTPVGGSGEAAP